MKVIDLVLNDWFNMLILRIILFGIQIFIVYVQVFKAHMYWVCISGTGQCCYSARVTNSNRKDEALSAESINPNNSFQTNKVSYSAEFAISMFML